MRNFQDEIDHSGGILTVSFIDGQLHCGYSNTNPFPTSVSQIGIILKQDGTQVEANLCNPSLTCNWHLFMLSDRTGFYGRQCPNCHSYFRTQSAMPQTYCCYCIHLDDTAHFLTQNQISFIYLQLRAILDLNENDKETVLDLDTLGNELEHNKPAWNFKDEKQQYEFTCNSCKVRTDVLGDYARCPCCAATNCGPIFQNRIDDIAKLVSEDSTPHANSQSLNQAVTALESLGQYYQPFLLPFADGDDKKQISDLNFQRLNQARERLISVFEFDIYNQLAEDQAVLIPILLGKRHLLTHRDGRVDRKYLEKTKDSSVRLHQNILITIEEAHDYIEILKLVGTAIINHCDEVVIPTN